MFTKAVLFSTIQYVVNKTFVCHKVTTIPKYVSLSPGKHCNYGEGI